MFDFPEGWCNIGLLSFGVLCLLCEVVGLIVNFVVWIVVFGCLLFVVRCIDWN